MPMDKDGFEVGAGFAVQPPAPTEAKSTPAPADKDADDFERRLNGEIEDEDDAHETDNVEEEDSDAEEGEEDSDDEEDPKPKKRKTAKDRIRELNRKLREAERTAYNDRLGFEARLERMEKGLPVNKLDDIKSVAREAPDPNDHEKYPLGALDDRYFEDKIEYVADLKAREYVDSVLQREQMNEQSRAQQAQAKELLDTANRIAEVGAKIHPDYESVVLEAGLKGEYKLDQPTFEAAADADHGAQILYDLATDPGEAARVASLTPYQQAKYVREKNDEIAGDKPQPRRKPKAPVPPTNPSPKGKSNKFRTPGDTDDLDAFEREWEKQF